MSGRKSRNKGNSYEREIVHALQDAGIAAERIPLSGAAGGSFAGDIKVSVPVLNADKTMECKRRAGGFKTLYGWLGENYALFVRDDHCPSLVVLRLEDFAQLARGKDDDLLRPDL